MIHLITLILGRIDTNLVVYDAYHGVLETELGGIEDALHDARVGNVQH